MSKKKDVAPEAEQPRDTEATAEVIETPEENPLAAELAAEKDRFARLAAEYDNFRKRTAREREALFSEVKTETVTQFLPVYDNLSRALLQECQDEAFRKGVEMTMTQLKSIMDALGVTEIEAAGKTFDPERHNAVMHIDDEQYGENEIVQELQKGFMLGDRVLRFSMVQVAN